MTEPYYQADGVTLYLGDCREVSEWLAADVLVTDPPYGIRWRRRWNKKRGSAAHEGIQNDDDTAARDDVLEMWTAVRPAVVFGSLYVPAPAWGVRHICVWEKPPDSGVVGAMLGFRRDVEAIYLMGAGWPRVPPSRGSVIRGLSRNAGNPSSIAGVTGHPHAKPGDVMESLIAHAPPGVVADPFAGSGSTLVAARNLGRAAVGVELEERYCEVAARRLDQAVLPL